MRFQISLIISYLNRHAFPFLNFSLRQYLKLSLAPRFQEKSVQGHLSEKNVKSRQRFSDTNSTRAGRFLLFLRYIDNIPDYLLWKEQLQWDVSFKCVEEFCHLSASHSDCSLLSALSGCRPPVLFPVIFLSLHSFSTSVPVFPSLFSLFHLQDKSSLLVSWIIAPLYKGTVSAIHQVWPSRCILMSAKYNDVCPLHDANKGRTSIVLRCPIRFAFDMTVWSDIIVLGMTDKLLTRSCLFQLLVSEPAFRLQCVL